MCPSFLALMWLAAPWYVDGDGVCPGDGSDAAPFCTIQDAFDNPALGAGDEILVRDSASPYGGAELWGRAGTAAARIVLRPDDGHAPILGGRVEIGGSSYWTVRGLVFDGQGVAGEHAALVIETSSTVVRGVIVEGNTILGWGDVPITNPAAGTNAGMILVASYPAEGGPTMIDPIVRDNRILGGRGRGIALTTVSGATIEGNEIAALSCQMGSDGPGIAGIYVHQSGGAVVRGNRVRDLDASDCALGGDVRVFGIGLQGSSSAEVHHNLVERVGGATDLGMGIDLVNSSNDAAVHHNIIVAADQCGLCNGTRGASGGARARFVNNTVVGGLGSGLELLGGEGSEFLNNVVVGAGRSQARILTTAVSTWTFEHNAYLPAPGEDNFGRFDYAAAVDFATWQSQCACDRASVTGDPLLPPLGTEEFTPASASVVVDRGAVEPEADRYNGEAPDLGAVEAPIVLGASISAGEPDRIRIDVQSETSAFRHDAGCEGITVTVDGAPLATTACALDGDRLLVALSARVPAAAVVVLAYQGWSLGNSDAIGGVVHGTVGAFEVDVDNGSQHSPPMGGGSSSGDATADTGVDASGDASTDGAVAADGRYPGVRGCGCGQPAGSGFAAWIVFALGWRRPGARRPPSASPRGRGVTAPRSGTPQDRPTRPRGCTSPRE